MTDLLALACLFLDIDQATVEKHRQDFLTDEYIVISNQGVAGTKKYRVPMKSLSLLAVKDDFTTNEPIADEDEPAGQLSSPETYNAELLKLDYKQLKHLAKLEGIKANQKKAELLAALTQPVPST